jgi:RTX calcium-binding nonapeptide repeat (4 copies)
MRNAKTKFGRQLTVAVASLSVVGTLGFAASAQAATHAKRSVVLHGHTCTVIATKHRPKVVGHAGDVVCGLKGNDTLTAAGPGVVFLIAGRGKDTLVASSDPNAHDTLIGGSGQDTIDAGSGGDDVIVTGSGSDNIDCGSSGSTVTVVGDDQGDNENQDCQGDNVDNAALQFEGTVNSTDGTTTMSVSVSDSSDAASSWLAANPSCDPSALAFDITNASIEVDNGGSLVATDDVEVEANAPASGCTLTAVSVQAQAGDDNSQGDNSQ